MMSKLAEFCRNMFVKIKSVVFSLKFIIYQLLKLSTAVNLSLSTIS